MGKKYTDNNGFLHLEGTPISRVQIAPYLGKQIDAKGQLKDEDGKRLLEPNKIYYVYRSAEELFKPETMKSFEGMPFRVGHQMLGKGTKKQGGAEAKVDNTPIDGTFFNVRRSEDKPDYLIADIVVYTDRAKNAIANGTKELSLGYRCAYLQDEGEYKGTPYQFRQTNIKANHLALVPHGRAGSSVCVQDEAIVDDDGLVVTCDSLPEEIQIMEKNEKEAKDKLCALLKGKAEDVQDCLDYCDLTPEQKAAVKEMKSEKSDDKTEKTDDVPAEDKACKGCGKDEIPAPVPPPAVEEKEKVKKETEVKPEPAAAPAPAPAEKTDEKPAPAPAPEAPAEDKAICPDCKGPKADEAKEEEKVTFTQDELDAACKKAAKEARKDALRAKALADAVGEDAAPDETEAQVARKACKKIKGLEQYAEDSRPDGEVLAAIRGHLAKQVADDDEKEAKGEGEDAKPKSSKKKILTVAQDEAIAKTTSTFSAAAFNQYLGAH